MAEAIETTEIQLFPETPEQTARRLENVPNDFEIPDDTIIRLGARNTSSIKRLVKIVKYILKRKIPIPRSKFAEYIANRLAGRDKQDFSMILSGRKGSGKSYSSIRLCQMVAEILAELLGGKPTDYFNPVTNCCLLEDTEGINRLIKAAGMYQIILIDDAGVAVGSRDFATQKNKNFNKLLATCRTKRWMIILNVPAKNHLDKQIRELVDCWAKVTMPCHDDGFNILKIYSLTINESAENKPYTKRYEFVGNDGKSHSIDLWVMLSPDEETAMDYDIRRDAAAQRIIDSSITGDEAPAMTKRDKKREEMKKKYGTKIVAALGSGMSATELRRQCPGLSNTMLETLRSELGV